MTCHLEQRRPEVNCRRFYGVEVQRDLFGHWLLLRRWGRIGTGGRLLVEGFALREEAEDAAQRLIRAKTRRGYGAVGEGP